MSIDSCLEHVTHVARLVLRAPRVCFFTAITHALVFLFALAARVEPVLFEGIPKFTRTARPVLRAPRVSAEWHDLMSANVPPGRKACGLASNNLFDNLTL